MKCHVCFATGLVVSLGVATARAQTSPAADPSRFSEPELHRREWVLGPGTGALIMPGAGRVGLALELLAYREIDDWAVGFQTTFATTDSQTDSGAQFVAASVGGRRYFGRGTVSAFVGLGLALSVLAEPGATVTYTYSSLCFVEQCPTTEESRRENLKTDGFGAYGEAGLELFRDHPIRLMAFVRVDAPFSKLELDNPSRGADSTTANGVISRYDTPITLNLGLGF